MRYGVEIAVCAVVAACSIVAVVAWPVAPGRAGPSGPGPDADSVAGVNATLVFERVERLVGEQGTRPRIVVERADVPFEKGDVAFDPFFAMFANVTRTPFRRVAASTGGETVRLVLTDRTTPAAVEQALVHEFAHVLQPDDLRDRLRDRVGDYAETTDGTLATYGVVEGAAVYVTEQYTDQFLPDAAPPTVRLRAAWREWSDANRLLWGPYLFGARYVAGRVASPHYLGAVYRRPPTTTEQLLHGLVPAAEPRRPLSVVADADRSGWSVARTDAKGELYVRAVLGSAVPENRAAAAAAGWGADRLLAFESGNRTGYAWVLRWDDTANATQFERAARTLDAGDDAAVRRVRVAPETVVVLAGDPVFVAGAGVSGGNASVTVTPPRRPRAYSHGAGWSSESDAAA